MTQTKSRKTTGQSKTGQAKAAVEISILVPVMNEAGNIRPLIDEISPGAVRPPF